MNYVTLLWSVVTASALLFALIHCLVWLLDHRARASLAFEVTSLKLADNWMMRAVFVLCVLSLAGCEDLVIHDVQSLFIPRFQRSEIVGLVAGFGTTFAAVPDLIKMLKRRSSEGMNPTMACIMGAFQVAWVYYGLLIQSRPVVAWNVVAVAINFLVVAAYFRFASRNRAPLAT